MGASRCSTCPTAVHPERHSADRICRRAVAIITLNNGGAIDLALRPVGQLSGAIYDGLGRGQPARRG